MSARRISLVLLVSAVVVWFSGAPAVAVHDTGTFELDGNPQSQAAAGDDWQEVFDGGGANFAEAFIRDWSDPTDTTYLHTGGSKDDLDFDQWERTTTDEAPDKDEIMNAFAAAYNVGGDLVLYFGADRFDDEGDAQMGFWFTQDDISITGTQVNGNHVAGDVLVQSNFTNGGKIGNVTVFQWVGSGGSHGTLDEVVSVDDADCADAPAGDDVCALVNTGEDVTPVWDFENKDGSEYNSGEFYEGGINLTDLGIETDCFSTFIAETRTAQPFDARLKDVAMGDFDTCATKKGTKFEDLNADGDRDSGEPVLSGWTIHIFGEGIHEHDVTDGSGNYEFGGLEPGQYTVCETQESGWSQSMPSGGADCTGHTHDGTPGPYGYAIDLDFGEVDAGNDFGNFRGAHKLGQKFEDTDGDGTKDSGEPAVAGVQIHLFGTDGQGNSVHEHDTTDGSGNYSFDVPPGNYTVCETQQAGWTQSYPASGADCSGHGGGVGYAISLDSNETDSGNDFGNFRGAHKSGTKFNDLNGDGDRDAGEPGIAGWQIHLFGSDGQGNSVHEHDTTDGSGNYSFDVPPGNYTVCETLTAGWTQSYPASGADCSGHGGGVGYAISLDSNETDSGNDFGNFQLGRKSGSKFEDVNGDGDRDEGEPGLEGWTIHIFDTATGGSAVHQHAVTGTDGGYTFDVPPGSYTVCEEQQAGWTQSYPAGGADCSGHGGGNGYSITLTSGGSDTGNDFGNFRQGHKLGQKFEDLNGDGDRDSGEPGVSGWQVHLFGTDGRGNSVHEHATTDGDGDYSFDVPPGSYTVCEQQQGGWTQSYPVSGADCSGHGGGVGYAISLDSNETDSGNDFGNFRNGAKAGLKFEDLNGDGDRDEGEPGLQGWEIHLFGTSGAGASVHEHDSTDANGEYSFSVPPGDYTVCETIPAGWVQSMPSTGADCSEHGGGVGYSISLDSNESDTGNDFGNFRNATKSGTKFEDSNADGDRDEGEPGLEGWEIHLFGTSGAGDSVHEHAATDAHGAYEFEVPPGNYAVCETIPDGWTQSYPGEGADCGEHTAGLGYDITLESNEADRGNDFGNYRAGTKTGTKFEDLNADGDRDEGEVGLEGWEIHLFGATGGGDDVHQHALTGSSGGYRFDVPPGTYTVCETIPDGWTQSYPTEGADCSEHGGGLGYAITLTSGGLDSGNDFGNFRNATKSGTKFNDLDADGARDDTDPGIEGWEVHLFGTDGGGNDVHEHASTDADGAYSFDVPPGTYTVCETLPADAARAPEVGLTVTVSPVSGSPGDEVTYEYVVTNTGDTVLTNIVVTDEVLGEFATVDVLEPGDSRSFTVSEVLSGEGDVTRSASVEADGGWTQSYPADGADCSAHGGGVGYAITLTSGQLESGNDFGNFLRNVADQDAAAVTVVLAERLPRTGVDAYPLVEIGFGLLGLGMLLRRGSRRKVVIEG